MATGADASRRGIEKEYLSNMPKQRRIQAQSKGSKRQQYTVLSTSSTAFEVQELNVKKTNWDGLLCVCVCVQYVYFHTYWRILSLVKNPAYSNCPTMMQSDSK